MPSHFRIATASGSPRQGSEDRFAVHHVPGGIVIVVADGAGGMGGGARAADLALIHVEQTIRATTFNPFTPRAWKGFLLSADQLIGRDRHAGETTAVVLGLANSGMVVGGSCGDSGALVARADGSFDDLTGAQHRKRLGSGRATPVAFERPKFDGVLIVATDGLLGYVQPHLVVEAVHATEFLERAAVALVDCARLPGGGLVDDVAVVLVA